jgi:hypothetical protein
VSSSSRAASLRADWPVRVYRLGAEPGDDLRAITSAEERLAMMWPLALEAWDLSGRAVPSYPRREAPVSLKSARAAGTARPGK